MKNPEMPWKGGDDKKILGIQRQLTDRIKTAFEITTWENRSFLIGHGQPAFTIKINRPEGLYAISHLDELGISEAYMNESIDIIGDMFQVIKLREELKDIHPFHFLWRRIIPLFINRVKANRKSIASHYDFDSDFYLSFMDKSRCYSQALFERDDEGLEQAQKRKLDFVIESCRLKYGDNVLDVGGGWGTFTEYAGLKGINVTSLTISDKSEKFIADLIQRLKLPCRVLNHDFLNFYQPEPFDAIVILGVMEHLPDYPAVINQLKKLLKPGGIAYIDASAFRHKFVNPSFISRHIFPGGHSFLCLHNFLTCTEKMEMEILQIINDRHSYYLTCRAWAERLEASRDEIIDRWGEMLFRRFRLYLWGSAYSFFSRGLCAYRVILKSPSEIDAPD